MSTNAPRSGNSLVLRDPPVIKSKSTKNVQQATPTAGSTAHASSSAVDSAISNNDATDQPEQFVNISNFDSVLRLTGKQVQNNGNQPDASEPESLPELVVEVTEKGHEKVTDKGKSSKAVKTTSKKTLKDPPVKKTASVVKGNRLKPQSEKRSNKRKTDKKKNPGAGPEGYSI
jgi:hypothetical protein